MKIDWNKLNGFNYIGTENLLIEDQDRNFKLGAHVKCSNFCKFSDGSGFEYIIFSFWLSDCDENLLGLCSIKLWNS